MKVFRAPKEIYYEIYPLIQDRVVGIVTRIEPRCTEREFAHKIMTGEWQLWVAWEEGERKIYAIGVTEIRTFGNGAKIAYIIMASGDSKERWYDIAIKEIERWARVEGCSILEAWVRLGWEAPYKSLGFKKTHIIMEKRLEPISTPDAIMAEDLKESEWAAKAAEARLQ